MKRTECKSTINQLSNMVASAFFRFSYCSFYCRQCWWLCLFDNKYPKFIPKIGIINYDTWIQSQSEEWNQIPGEKRGKKDENQNEEKEKYLKIFQQSWIENKLITQQNRQTWKTRVIKNEFKKNSWKKFHPQIERIPLIQLLVTR